MKILSEGVKPPRGRWCVQRTCSWNNRGCGAILELTIEDLSFDGPDRRRGAFTCPVCGAQMTTYVPYWAHVEAAQVDAASLLQRLIEAGDGMAAAIATTGSELGRSHPMVKGWDDAKAAMFKERAR